MKKWTLTRIIATTGCLLAAISLAVFLALASDRVEDSSNDPTQRYENARLITPKTFGSYGELMFAYAGENNYLYDLDNESIPLICQPVKELLYASDDSVLYTASCEMDSAHPGRESVIQELQIGTQGNRVHTIAQVTVDPCWSSNDEVIYYVEDEAANRLCTFEPLTSTSEIAAEFEQDIIGLRISSDGLLVMLDDSMELLYVPLSKQLTVPGFVAKGSVITVCEQYDLLLSAEGSLSYHWQGADDTVLISEDVLIGISHQDNEIYYIHQSSGRTELMCYTVSEEQHQVLASLDSNVLPQLTSDADYAFVLTEQGIVYRYDIQESILIPYHFIDTASVRAPMISLFDYRLMIYDLAKEQDASYCYSIPSDVALTAEETEQLAQQAKDLTTEAGELDFSSEISFLSMGSTGEKVLALQNILNSRGYLQVAPTGIYGTETLYAVSTAQSDLNLPETGFADRLFQTLLVRSDASNQIRSILENDDGIRARNLTARLITLGYILQSDAERPNKLQDGVALYCAQNNLPFDGAITEDIQLAIFSKDALLYSGYHELVPGDRGEACSAVNEQLFRLDYSQYSSRPVIDNHTHEAIQLFASVNGVAYDLIITRELQEALLAAQAAACPEQLSPSALADAKSATPGQVITDKELKVLRKWLTKSFAVNHTDKQAVKRLQVRLIRLGYLEQGEASMIYDDKTAEAVRQFQSENGLTIDGVPSKRTLMGIFGIANSILSGE